MLITRAESLDQLHEKIELAKSLKGVSQEERQRIIEKVADLAGNAVEYYKALASMSYSLGKTCRDFCVFGEECEAILEFAFERGNMLLQIFRLDAMALKRPATGLIIFPELGGDS